VFVDLTGVLRSPAGRRLMPRVLDVMDGALGRRPAAP
jgi:hypothetical protein